VEKEIKEHVLVFSLKKPLTGVDKLALREAFKDTERKITVLSDVSNHTYPGQYSDIAELTHRGLKFDSVALLPFANGIHLQHKLSYYRKMYDVVHILVISDVRTGHYEGMTIKRPPTGYALEHVEIFQYQLITADLPDVPPVTHEGTLEVLMGADYIKDTRQEE